jgi:hypothetical protein
VLESDIKNETIPWRVRELILNTNDSYFVPIKDFRQFVEFLWWRWHEAEEVGERHADSFINRAFEKATELSEQLKVILSNQNRDEPLTGGVALSEIAFDFSKMNRQPVSSPFIAFGDETTSVLENGYTPLNQVVSHFNNLDLSRKPLARLIIKLVGDYVFLNSHILTLYVNEQGLSVSQDKVLSSLKELANASILLQYRFSTPKITSNFSVFSLAYCGDKLYRQLYKVKPAWNDTLKLSSSVDIKRYLAASQAIIAVKKVANVHCRMSPKLGNSVGGVRASAAFRHVKDDVESTYLIEVIRRKPDWEIELSEKLGRYNNYFAKSRGQNICLILCGEDNNHIASLYKVCNAWRENACEKMIPNYLTSKRVWFTHDIAFLSDKLYHTFLMLYQDDHGNILALPIDFISLFGEDANIANSCENHPQVAEFVLEMDVINEDYTSAQVDDPLSTTLNSSKTSIQIEDEETAEIIIQDVASEPLTALQTPDKIVALDFPVSTHIDTTEEELSDIDKTSVSSESIAPSNDASSSSQKEPTEPLTRFDRAQGEDTPDGYTTNDSKIDLLKNKILQVCKSIATIGQPVPMAPFAIALKNSGIDYHEYGYSKLINFLQSQNEYLIIEGTGANKYIRLDVDALTKKENLKIGQPTANHIQRTQQVENKNASPNVSVLLRNIYLGNIRALLEALGSMAGSYVSLDCLAASFKNATELGRVHYGNGFMTFFTGYQHPTRGGVYMRCTNNDRVQPWKFETLFY